MKQVVYLPGIAGHPANSPALDIVADGPPRVRWNPVSQGYDLDHFMVRLRS